MISEAHFEELLQKVQENDMFRHVFGKTTLAKYLLENQMQQKESEGVENS